MAGSGNTNAIDTKTAKQLRGGDVREGAMVSFLRRHSIRKGFMGESKPWLYIGAATWGYRMLRRMARRRAQVVLFEELKPGQRIIISNDRPTVDVS